MPSTRKITIYDIAGEAGVSASTVASVLNGTWKARRVGEETAKAVQSIASKKGYSINLQARGLRKSRSGLIGMIVPMLDNRFFSSLAQAFEEKARQQGLYPVVVSTLRDPESERATVRALISHNVDALFLAGATDPDSLSDICASAGVKHINVDLPGKKSLSVISDNISGAKDLTREIVKAATIGDPAPKIYFIGGIAEDHNTQSRIRGFSDILLAAGIPIDQNNIRPTGYEADLAETTIREVYAHLGMLPDGLFVNSTIAFEGIARFFKTIDIEEVRKCAIGCFDYDPYIEMLHFKVFMIRQNVNLLINESYRLLYQSQKEEARLILIPTELILPSIKRKI